MGHLFISYSREDRKRVHKLVKILEKEGHEVFLDTKDIEGGEQWRRTIVGAIRQGHALIVAISPKSVQSRNVRKELDVAEEAHVRIIPVRLAPTAVPDSMQYQLAGIQEVDLSGSFKAGVDRLNRVLTQDSKVKKAASGRRWTKVLFWAVGGAAVGGMVATALGGDLIKDIEIGLLVGAILGFAGGYFLKLIGWISKLIVWGGGLLGGAVAGIFVVWLGKGAPETLSPDTLLLSAAVGAGAVAVLLLYIKARWKKRKQKKLEALALRAG